MKPEYIEELANAVDPDQLYRLSYEARCTLSPEKTQQLDAGIALRRYASHIRRLHGLIGSGESLLITALSEHGTATMTVPTPENHLRLANPT